MGNIFVNVNLHANQLSSAGFSKIFLSPAFADRRFTFVKCNINLRSTYDKSINKSRRFISNLAHQQEQQVHNQEEQLEQQQQSCTISRNNDKGPNINPADA